MLFTQNGIQRMDCCPFDEGIRVMFWLLVISPFKFPLDDLNFHLIDDLN